MVSNAIILRIDWEKLPEPISYLLDWPVCSQKTCWHVLLITYHGQNSVQEQFESDMKARF